MERNQHGVLQNCTQGLSAGRRCRARAPGARRGRSSGGAALMQKQRMSRLAIVDGHAYAYRAFYAIRELRSPTGQPTNAIYGFIKMLTKLRAKLAPTHLIVVWDGGLDADRMA